MNYGGELNRVTIKNHFWCGLDQKIFPIRRKLYSKARFSGDCGLLVKNFSGIRNPQNTIRNPQSEVIFESPYYCFFLLLQLGDGRGTSGEMYAMTIRFSICGPSLRTSSQDKKGYCSLVGTDDNPTIEANS